MRRPAPLLAALLLLLGAPIARAQAPTAAARPVSAADSTTRELALLARLGRVLPGAPDVTTGERTVAAGTTVPGPVAARHGTLHVRGTIHGDAIALRGDVVVHPGGQVDGDALAVGGKVVNEGGRILGGTEVVDGALYVTPVAPATPADPVRRALAALAIALVVGLGVLVAAARPLEAVAEVLTDDVNRAFGVGVLAQLGILPALVVICLLLALSILGILLIPFAIVAFVLAVAGLLALGTLAAALVAGRGLLRTPSDGPERTRRTAQVRGLIAGIVLLALPLLAAAAFGGTPVVGLALRTLGVALLWSAATAGLGAAVLARGGSRRTIRVTASLGSIGWQTPTPIAGIVAARRPSQTPSPAPRD